MTLDPIADALEACSREPIHTPGAVQSFACLVVFRPDFTVSRASANVTELFGRSASSLLDCRLEELLPTAAGESVRAAFRDCPPGEVLDLGPIVSGRIGLAHVHAGERLLELVPSDSIGAATTSLRAADVLTPLFQDAAHLLTAGLTVTEYCRKAVGLLRERTGYDRVMVYQFTDDWCGEVLAESLRAELPPFVGLRFPSSDIPPQARDLYTLVKIRVLADVLAAPVPIVSQVDAADRELDLSFALSRGFSPIHREYLTNMRVRASCSASIIRDGRLWGLIACHHREPYLPGPSVRRLIAAMADMIAVQTELFDSRERARGVALGRKILGDLPDILGRISDLHEGLVSPAAGLMESLGADGIAVVHADGVWTRGVTPPKADIRRIAERVLAGKESVRITNRFGSEEPGFAELRDTASGLIALRVPHSDGMAALWFRGEVAATVRWAGDPRKGLIETPTGARLCPRTSFETWLAEVHGTSRHWSVSDRALVGEVIRNNLVEILAGVQRQQIRDLRTYHGVLFEQVNDAVVITDNQDQVTFWNEAATRLYGWSRGEVLGRPLNFSVPSDEKPQLANLMHTVEKQGDVLGEMEVVRKDARRIWIDYRMQTLLDAQGQAAGMLSISRDITSRKSTEAERRLLSAVATSTRDAILITEAGPLNPPGPRIVYVNPAFQTQTGYSANEVIGRTPRMFQTAGTDRRALDSIRSALTHWQPVRAELLNRRKDGSEFWVEIDITPLADPTGWYTHWISIQREITERKSAEEALRQSEQRFRLLTETIEEMVTLYDPIGQLLYATPTRHLQFQNSDRDPLAHVHPDDRHALNDSRRRNLKGERTRVEWRMIADRGRTSWFESTAAPVHDSAGNVTGVVVCSRDISRRKSLEDHVRQKQKLEAIGGLAAGVAHDFNNLLSIVNLNVRSVTDGLPDDHPDRRPLEDVLRAAARGADLTKQLLAFGRRSVRKIEVLDPNKVVEDTVRMLSRLIGDEILITLDLDVNIGQVRADAGHLTQILMNLVTNARDAMPTGGRLRVETTPVHIERGYSNPDASPKWYARMTVSDTGQGMPAEVAARAFEPFYTTKPIGLGTGLGLAMVYGLVRQAGGFVELESATGVGTAIRVYFPRSDENPEPSLAGLKPLPPQGECIFLAEDDDRLRVAIAGLLMGAGYSVTTAASGLEALTASETLQNRIDLLLTDVSMPGMDGRALATELRSRHPKLRVVFMSGYAADGISDGDQDSRTAFLQKPFDPDTLLWFIRETLDSPL